jgi:hypothetical protein
MQGASGLLVAVPRNCAFLISPAVEVVQQDSTVEEEEEAPADPGPADTNTGAAAEPAAAGSKPPTKAAPAGRGRRGAAPAEKQ